MDTSQFKSILSYSHPLIFSTLETITALINTGYNYPDTSYF